MAVSLNSQLATHALNDVQEALLRRHTSQRDGYVLSYTPAPPGKLRLPFLTKPGRGLRGCAQLALQAGASAENAVQALLQVAHLRRLPYRRDLSPQDARDWALRESHVRAVRDRDAFLRDMRAQKWQTEHVLLSSAERAPFVV